MSGRRGLVILILFNLAALVPVVLIVESIWRHAPVISDVASFVLATVAGVVYSFLILLTNKFLIQNRTDRLPLTIARASFVMGCAVTLAMTVAMVVAVKR